MNTLFCICVIISCFSSYIATVSKCHPSNHFCNSRPRFQFIIFKMFLTTGGIVVDRKPYRVLH